MNGKKTRNNLHVEDAILLIEQAVPTVSHRLIYLSDPSERKETILSLLRMILFVSTCQIIDVE